MCNLFFNTIVLHIDTEHSTFVIVATSDMKPNIGKTYASAMLANKVLLTISMS